MLDEQLAALKARLAADPAFKAQLQAATSRAQAEQVLAAHGINVSQILGAAMRSVMLNDSELQTNPNDPYGPTASCCPGNPTLC